MPKRVFEACRFQTATLDLVVQANEIIESYQEDGFDLTLRQLYYQFVARGLLDNTQQNYKKLGDIISKARRAGLVDWNAIVDRTRLLRGFNSWDSPSTIVEQAARQFRVNVWANQPVRLEVWFEKDALLGVFERACAARRIPYFSCRGYASDSEIFSAAERLREFEDLDSLVILHFGDHDPSGLDMTRDIQDRLRLLGAPMHLEEERGRQALDLIARHYDGCAAHATAAETGKSSKKPRRRKGQPS